MIMKEHFILITTDNRIRGVRTENPSLMFYYSMIGCRSIEIVRPFPKAINKARQIMVIDEGRIRNNPRINVIASMLAGQSLYGNVLIAKEDFRNGEPDICGYDRQSAEAIITAIRVALSASGCFEEMSEEGETE